MMLRPSLDTNLYLMDYQVNALDFAKSHSIKLSIISFHYGTMPWDTKNERYIFKCRLTRGRKQYTLDFGQSIFAGAQEPTMYDVLACLQKYDVGDLADFCADFGYEPNKQARETYKAVCREWRAVERLFGDIIEELQEIQ